MSKQTPTTQAHFEQFCTYARSFIAALGLHDWHVVFFHSMPDPDSDALAEITLTDCNGRIAQIALNPVWPSSISDEMLRYVAAHEVLHLLCADMTTTSLHGADLPMHTRFELSRAEHSAINRLVNIVLRGIE